MVYHVISVKVQCSVYAANAEPVCTVVITNWWCVYISIETLDPTNCSQSDGTSGHCSRLAEGESKRSLYWQGIYNSLNIAYRLPFILCLYVHWY